MNRLLLVSSMVFPLFALVKSDDCVPPSLMNGEVYGEGDISSWTGEFKCKPGFSLVGSSRLKCRNGQWSASIPACAATGRCDPEQLPNILHGRKDPYKSTKYRGAVYRYSCSRGFKRLGSNLVHCNGDQWDLQRLPICSRRGCDEDLVKDIVHGQSKRKAHGGVYFFKCDPTSVLVGSPVVICDGNHWNDTAPSCITPTQHPKVTLRKDGAEVSEIWAETPVSIFCEGQGGNPEPLISLLKNGNPIGEPSYGTNSFNIVPTIEDNSAVFACSAENAAMSGPVSSELVLNVKYGPSRVDIGGPDHLSVGETGGFECVSSPSNPPTKLEWKVTNNVGEDLSNLLKSSEQSTSWNKGGWQTTSSAILHGVEGATALQVQCEASNSKQKVPVIGQKHVVLKFAPEKVMLSGPSKALLGSEVTLQCESSPSVPAATLSWSVVCSEKTSKYYPEEAVEQLEDGSFITRSWLDVIVSGCNTMMVECYGTNELLDNDFEAFAHVIEVLSPPGDPIINGASTETKKQNLTCSTLAGNPPASLSWYRGEEKIDSVYHIDGNFVTSKINFIPESSKEVITCEASNEVLSEPVRRTVTIESRYKENQDEATESENNFTENVNQEVLSEIHDRKRPEFGYSTIHKNDNRDTNQNDITTTRQDYVTNALDEVETITYETETVTQSSTLVRSDDELITESSESPTDAVYVLPDKQASNTHSRVTAVDFTDATGKEKAKKEMAAHLKYIQDVDHNCAPTTGLNFTFVILVMKLTAVLSM